MQAGGFWIVVGETLSQRTKAVAAPLATALMYVHPSHRPSVRPFVAVLLPACRLAGGVAAAVRFAP